MTVAELLSPLTGRRTLRKIPLRFETTARRSVATLWLWWERARQRRALARLDEALLRDIGRSRQEVALERAKPMWRA